MRRRTLVLCWLGAVSAWTGLAYCLFSLNVGSIAEPVHHHRLLYYALAVLAPLLTFYPMSRIMDLRTFALEATICWTGLILVVTFLSPDATGMPGYLVFMLLFFGAVSSIFLPLGYWLGYRLLTLRAHRRDTGRARREAYLAGLFVALSLAMNMGGFYNWLNALLLLLILVLVESFALAHKPGTGTG